MAQEVDSADAELDQELAAAIEETPAPEVDQPAETPAPSSALAALLRSNGWDVDPTTTDEEAVAYIREQEAAAARAAQAEERAKQLEAWYAASQQPKPAETPTAPVTPVAAEPAKPKREVPEYDPEWESVLKLDDNGQIVTVAGWVDPSIPGKYQKYQKWLKTENARLLREPATLLRESGYEDELKTRLLTPYEERIAALEKRWEQQTQKQVVSQRDQFLVNNAHFYAETDADGQPVLDEQGLLKPNANYQRFLEHEAALEEAGITDPEKRFKLAVQAVPPTQATAAAPAPVATPADKRAKVRNRVAGKISKTLAQPPVSRSKGGATELVERPASIGQLKNKWLGMLEQGVGGDE